MDLKTTLDYVTFCCRQNIQFISLNSAILTSKFIEMFEQKIQNKQLTHGKIKLQDIPTDFYTEPNIEYFDI